MIIQSYIRKAFTEDIFDNLKSKKSRKDWSQGSLGASFRYLIDTIMHHMEIKNMENLMEKYKRSPEEIDRAVCEIFSKVLKNK